MDNKTLVLDLVEWVAQQSREYDDVMNAWRTSCPRLTVWEDTVDAGFVRVESRTEERLVRVTDAGRRFLHDNGRLAPTR